MSHEVRLFADCDAIRQVGMAFLDRNLPKSEWTHEAHLATCAWIILERPDLRPEQDMPELIRGYNVSVGGVNSDSEGYHETITQVSIRSVRSALARQPEASLSQRVNGLLKSPEGERGWPLRFYSRDRLFSKTARLGWVEPDLHPLDGQDGADPGARVTNSTE